MPHQTSSLTYDETKAAITVIESAMKPHGDYLKGCPRGPMGLTHDSVKSTPEWRQHRAEYDRLFAEMRRLNAYLTRTYKSEIQTERRAKFPNRY